MQKEADVASLLSGLFFTESERREVLAEMALAQAEPARVVLGATDTIRRDVRDTSRLAVSGALLQRTSDKVELLRCRLEGHFRRPLGAVQEPQFLRYEVGQFFRAHQDLGDPELKNEPARRSVSVVVLLNTRDYDGGNLVVYGVGMPDSKLEIKGRPGGFVAFDSVLVHEVTPVSRGLRYSVAAWFQKP